MIFAEKQARLTARLRSTTGRAADAEHLQTLVGKIRNALPDEQVASVVMQEDILYVAQPEQMALYGVTYSALHSTLKNALNENTLFTINSGDESLPVVVGNNLRNLDDLLGRTFIKANGAEIPVGVFMKQTRTRDLKSIVAGAEGDYYPVNMNPDSKDIPRIMQTIREVVAQDGRFEVSFSVTSQIAIWCGSWLACWWWLCCCSSLSLQRSLNRWCSRGLSSRRLSSTYAVLSWCCGCLGRPLI